MLLLYVHLLKREKETTNLTYTLKNENKLHYNIAVTTERKNPIR